MQLNVWNHKIIANSPHTTSWVLIQRTLCHQNINRQRETITKNNFSEIGKGKQLTWVKLLWFGWLHLWHVAKKSFETIKVRNRRHQRLQFQHASESTSFQRRFHLWETEWLWDKGRFHLQFRLRSRNWLLSI